MGTNYEALGVTPKGTRNEVFDPTTLEVPLRKISAEGPYR